jgi:hypothetical protein
MKNTNNNNMSIVPVASYNNADTLKLTIYPLASPKNRCGRGRGKDNKNKSGIYRFTNNITGESYIGYSVNLSARFAHYYSFAYLNRIINKSNSIICRALLKYGYSSFTIDIMEYCDPSVLRER